MGSTKSELYRFVNQLYEYFDIDYNSFPVNTVGLCTSGQRAEVQYHSFKTSGFCAAILLGSKIDTIILNSNRDSVERNFDCGHEIIHMTKHRNLGIDTFSCMELKSKRQSSAGFLEWEANEGAAQFLVPHYSLLPEIKKVCPRLKKWQDFHEFKLEMSEKYGVTDAVINFRFESLKYEIQQYLDGVSIENISVLSSKQQLAKGIHVESFNDIEGRLWKWEYGAHDDVVSADINIWAK